MRAGTVILEGHSQVDNLPANAINDVALDFFVRLRAPAATEADRQACARWLAADPAHRLAWGEVEALWSELDAVDVSDLARAPMQLRRPAMVSRRQIWRLAAAAAVAGGGFAAWTVSDPGFGADYKTARGERRPIALPDGSQALLDTRSAMSLAYDATRRGVKLATGAGYFEVAGNDSRPFVVTAGNLSITAPDSAFEVRQGGSAQRVSVASGAVDISSADGGVQRLVAGETMRSVDDRVGEIEPIVIGDIAAWRQDRMIFRRTPLAEVAAEFERYRAGVVIVTDPDLAARQVSGVFDTRRTDQALATIADAMSAKLMRISNLVVLIQPIT